MKKRKLGVRQHQIFIVVMAAALMTVLLVNILLMHNIASDQAKEIGRMRVQNIATNFQKSLTRAENTLERVGNDLSEIMQDGATEEEIRQFLVEQKEQEYDLSGGLCLNVFCVIDGNVMISGMETPKDYVLQDRAWYRGLQATKRGEIYVSPTYDDMFTDNRCFTVAKILDDGTVVAADYNVSEIQSYVNELADDGYGDAMIVDSNEIIVGYSDTDMIGKKLSSELPQYRDVFLRIIASDQESLSLRTRQKGMDSTMFCSRTENGWYLMCSVDNWMLYRENYRHLIQNFLLALLMIVVFTVVYLFGGRKKWRMELEMSGRRELIADLSDKIEKPLKTVLEYGEAKAAGGETPAGEDAAKLRQAGKEIADVLSQLEASKDAAVRKSLREAEDGDSGREREEKGRKNRKNRKNPMDFSIQEQRKYQIGITAIFILTMLVTVFICARMTISESRIKMEEELRKYNYEVGDWILEQKSILDMFENVVAAKPELLDDYDKMVKFLDDITKHYPKISATYIANPDFAHGHPMVMNNGWVPEPDYVEEERVWYKGALTAEDFNITEPYYDARTGEYCITFSKVVQSERGEFYGVFAIDFYLDVLTDILGEGYSDEGYAFLVDKNGLIIDHPNSEYEFSDEASVNIHDLVYDRLYSEDGIVMFRDYDGVYRVADSMEENDSGFRIIVVKDWWSIYGNVLEYMVLFVGLFGICIIGVNMVIHKMIRWQWKTNENLKEMAMSAIRAEQAKSLFLSNMSHEIRTPINAVLGMNEMILRECSDEQLLLYAENIQSAGKTLLFLINDILDMSKIESGKMEIVPVEYDVGDLLMDLWNVIYLRAQEKGLGIRFHIAPDTPRILFGDDVRIKQIVTNLLTNAVKYTPQGGVEMNVSCRREAEGEISLILSVKDTGIGIREEDMGKLFESFQRLDEKKNRNIEGTGLGMSITMSLLKLMGGNMEVESVYQKGSTFTVTIPQKVMREEPAGEFEEIRKRKKQVRGGGKKSFEAPEASVMVVDDNTMNRSVFQALLKRTKVKITAVASGRECLELVKKEKYHIIFMDHMMPEMDGIETLHAMREIADCPNEETPVIALTANAIAGAKEMYMKEGFTDFMTKPIEGELLEKMVAEYLPGELVKYVEETKEETMEETMEEKGQDETQESGQMTEEEERFLKEGVSIKSALHYAGGNMKVYLDMMEVFLREKENQEKKIQTFLEKEDMPNYAVLVHGLKGNARMLGADHLADIAFEHEKASKADQLDFVKEHYEELTREWARIHGVFDELYHLYRSDEEEKYAAVESGELVEITPEELETVASLLDEFQTDQATEQLKSWLECHLSPQMHDRIRGALLALEEEFDEDKAIEILRS